MNICDKTTTTKKIIPESGRLYRNLSLKNEYVYIYCSGKRLFVNLSAGSFFNYQPEVDTLEDVTDQYCLQKV